MLRRLEDEKKKEKDDMLMKRLKDYKNGRHTFQPLPVISNAQQRDEGIKEWREIIGWLAPSAQDWLIQVQ